MFVDEWSREAGNNYQCSCAPWYYILGTKFSSDNRFTAKG